MTYKQDLTTPTQRALIHVQDTDAGQRRKGRHGYGLGQIQRRMRVGRQAAYAAQRAAMGPEVFLLHLPSFRATLERECPEAVEVLMQYVESSRKV